jgi:spore maturation protein CgeB
MKISFFGSSLVSCYWNGAATYYRGILREIALRGHEITFFESDAFERQEHRDIPDPPWAQVCVYPATPEGWQRSLISAAAADLVIKASGVGIFDRELDAAIASLPAHILRAYWDVDAPATLDAIEHDSKHHLREAIPAYDMVFTYGGGARVVAAYKEYGARDCVPIYNALDPATHYPEPPQAEFACDLGLLANRLPDREQRIDSFFLGVADRLPQRRFVLGGSGWESKAVPANVRKAGHVGTSQHNAFYSSGLATLNVNRDSMAKYGFSPPTRIFEAAGAGACLITDQWDGIDAFLEPEREVLVAANGDQVAEHLASLSPERARLIAERARRQVMARHTYAHRARQFDHILNGLDRGIEAA